MKGFFEKLGEEVLLADGATGTLLSARGWPVERLKSLANLESPDEVREVHEDYVDAGAQIIETNTFDANRVKLMAADLPDADARFEEINRRAVALAREATRGEYVFVAGSVGPLGAMVKPYGRLSIAEVKRYFAEQIRVLVDAGVDLLVIETMSNLLEAEQAVRAAREISRDLPVVAQITVLQDGHTKFGDAPLAALTRLAAAGANVVGLNCTIGPQETYDLVAPIARQGHLLVSAQPNAGYPTIVAGRNLYLSSPEYLREYARAFIDAGVVIVGGCCGTTPEHVRAMAKEVRGAKPRTAASPLPAVEFVFGTPAPLERPDLPHSPLARKLERALHSGAAAAGAAHRPVVTCEMAPPKGADCSRAIAGGRQLRSAGVDAIEVADSPLMRVRMSPLAFAHLLQQETGAEVILQLTCRDRTILALQSELLGAAALGIRAVLAITGEPSAVGDYPRPAAPLEVDSLGLVRLVAALNSGRDALRNSIGEPTSLLVGALAYPASKDLGREVARLAARVEAGAQYIQTQPVFELGTLERFRAAAAGLGVPMLAGLMPLRSLRQAKYLANEVPGIHLPEAIVARLAAAGAAAAVEGAAAAELATGIAIARELFAGACGLAEGIHFMPLDRPEMVVETLREADVPAGVPALPTAPGPTHVS